MIEEARKAREEGREKVILFNWSGHGLLDLGAYDKYFACEIQDIILSEADMAECEKVFEKFPKPKIIKSRIR